jgi:hypothetical protein
MARWRKGSSGLAGVESLGVPFGKLRTGSSTARFSTPASKLAGDPVSRSAQNDKFGGEIGKGESGRLLAANDTPPYRFAKEWGTRNGRFGRFAFPPMSLRAMDGAPER